jgi:hypothetical protein
MIDATDSVWSWRTATTAAIFLAEPIRPRLKGEVVTVALKIDPKRSLPAAIGLLRLLQQMRRSDHECRILYFLFFTAAFLALTMQAKRPF